MAQIITIAAAFEQWDEGGGMGSPSEIFGDDEIAKSESWNNFTDGLCKDGQLNDLQYHYCPSYDEVNHSNDWDCEMNFLLGEMGVEIYTTQNYQTREDWAMVPATHWNVTISRSGKEVKTIYSMGAAHTGEPQIEDVVGCILRDSYGIECANDFEDWAETYGYDTDSRKAYTIWEACKHTADQVKEMFNKSEFNDLLEIANEM